MPLCAAEQKKPAPFMAKSFIIPGWGELSQDAKSGYVFIVSEILFWGTMFYYKNESSIKGEEALNYAYVNAGVNSGLHYGDEYLRLLSRYDNSGFGPGGYNAMVYEVAQTKENPEAYIRENIIPEEKSWQWQGKRERKKYSTLKTDETNLNDTAKTFMGVIIANHLLSSLNSVRIFNKNKRLNFSATIDEKCNPSLGCSVKF